MVLESADGSWWGPVDFSASGSKILALKYVSRSDSRVHIIDLDSGEHTQLVGGDNEIGTNFPVGFDHDDSGFWYISDAAGEFEQLAWRSLEDGGEPEFITSDMPWNID